MSTLKSPQVLDDDLNVQPITAISEVFGNCPQLLVTYGITTDMFNMFMDEMFNFFGATQDDLFSASQSLDCARLSALFFIITCTHEKIPNDDLQRMRMMFFDAALTSIDPDFAQRLMNNSEAVKKFRKPVAQQSLH